MRICYDFKIRIWSEKLVDGPPNTPLTAWDALALGSTVWGCFKNNFLSPIPSLNCLKFHSNSGRVRFLGFHIWNWKWNIAPKLRSYLSPINNRFENQFVFGACLKEYLLEVNGKKRAEMNVVNSTPGDANYHWLPSPAFTHSYSLFGVRYSKLT